MFSPALRGTLAALALTSIARAQGGGETEVAAQFFEAGVNAAKKGEFRACAEAFTEAHKRAPHGATIYNAALCWEGAKDRARAANDYKAALELGSLSDAQGKQAKQKLASLGKELGRLNLREPAGRRASVGPIDQKPIPFVTFVEPGEHEVKVEGRDGELVTRSVSVEAGQEKRVSLTLDEDENDPAPAAPRPESSPERDSTGDLQRTLGWALVGVSAAAAAIGVGFYVSALGAKQSYDDSGHTNAGDRQDAIDRYSVARGFWIGAGVAAAGGVTLILIAPKKPASAGALRLRVHPTGADASLSF